MIGPFRRSPEQGQISREQRGRGGRHREAADAAWALAALCGDAQR